MRDGFTNAHHEIVYQAETDDGWVVSQIPSIAEGAPGGRLWSTDAAHRRRALSVCEHHPFLTSRAVVSASS